MGDLKDEVLAKQGKSNRKKKKKKKLRSHNQNHKEEGHAPKMRAIAEPAPKSARAGSTKKAAIRMKQSRNELRNDSKFICKKRALRPQTDDIE